MSLELSVRVLSLAVRRLDDTRLAVWPSWDDDAALFLPLRLVPGV